MKVPGSTFDKQEQRLLTLWAADCADRVLKRFEMECPGDGRPRWALVVARAWAKSDLPMQMAEIRCAALAAHAAARSVENVVARAAARAAGHAVATVHVSEHARGAADYAVKAIEAKNVLKERAWQYSHLPISIREKMFYHLVYATVAHIPKGRVATYGQLAKLAGNPRGARAVGMAMKRNPNIKGVPCYRVVTSDGALTGYAFGRGTTTKKKLLMGEGVQFIGDRVDLRVSGWKK
ncbi:MAG: hypothetical protein UX49_C0034G0011 [Candidatus Wolfebacteria bacterium GW2011_GWC2_46_275]|uniref:Uncharacterized protein n=2 Tax=Candidatus Wolfeibacteriota TaxID=1752735 RepID=A0A0G1U5Y3_9BACT|nr:MAG: hypothetical protein UX70_C0001G0580 [Candidatus Wolfebacteria bacterium GW2011_GWB1_47_1]KKU34828.1 MAG: hypothetical protein UX49_C0034G0011 [Candidatus Wolfebacteria bacterium GW2011_GWC2_46_275]KKU42489.1 MAG: hypothetical protein UX58_C0002G0203 [Candidatus Wolfebacteria bacterium GW2011_GWB2_46_69]KKU54274.1 MAG: hypothetical protein UX76_C0004G0078 [Candidatus Wolfebacteria bacterium GW2011_GWC1_47_103]KKU59642.1 MAG: hypothetical protein UX83_C0003G0057 [Candidatus Wolfebacteria